MVRLTLIFRIVDGLPLAEGLDKDEMESYKSQAKMLCQRFKSQPSQQPTRLSVESDNAMFHYLLESGVVFLTLTEKGYPKKLAFQYLEELAREFGRLYGSQVDTVQRPYAFIKFDTFIQKTKKLYLDTRTQRNMAMLNDDLSEVHSIMTRNIQEVLGQGEKLDNMTRMSSSLVAESKQYVKGAKNLRVQAFLRKHLPLVVVVVVVLLVLWLRRMFYSR
uniref:Uncharacterized protein n=1 Tax=Dunaliella tertiolecta TaxID=3047 RepID=A0A7S3VHR9_DUNTE|mmetsp:Transcript_5520/g.14892  ORF Transcript_5520/g.14892 Transcript_5520/m.14892 type:complete len:218 (+) Transcript_5520:78-731(+)|eukprot:CAMPEP_0202357376 /NCGR_PEP_ID=MMETSP1126-20121109/11425_1 /ASSEMBLY_ACC=CAM_ASM_000457 /TAXON_ID=3047 /ORGANISM="Dunaliella tertiolecta, Strain CCMP1320" /LENGTH=217 /DNA_ID=CAMNT_0048950239 /DNA_START=50 /DNA_END=703 /DNA_ORIENTATION=-